MHPNGNANVRAALTGFNEAGMLQAFYTAIAVFNDSLVYKLNFGPLAEFKRREFDLDIKKITKTHPYKEIVRLLSLKLGFKSMYADESSPFSVDSVYHELDNYLARQLRKGLSTDAIYAYEDGALDSFKAARSLGIRALYDLPIGYWRMARFMMKNELELNPEWGVTITGMKDSEEKLERKDKELELADGIFVASTFTANSLSLYPGKLSTVKVIPYGFPNPVKKDAYGLDKSKPLKLLYVGGLSQRKGISYLFDAADKLGKSVELTIVGGKSNVECPVLDKALQKVKWIPSLPHHAILELMSENDVLVFPSLFEGFGLVITEAMSRGIPVITTDRTAGPDIISNNKDGWIVDAGSSDSLIEKLTQLHEDRQMVAEAGSLAFEKALSRSWKNYGAELAKEVGLMLS